MLLQQIVNGILSSGIYALFAVGFTMIFGIMRVLNMAHGDFAIVAALGVVWAAGLGFGPAVAVAAAIAATVLLACLVERLAIRPCQRFPGDAALEMPLIATIGAGMVLQNTAALLFGNKAIIFPYQMIQFERIGGVLVSKGLIVSAVVAVVVLAVLEIVVHQTSFGRQIRAVAQNRNAARIMGINVNAIVVSTMALTAVLAAIAGCLVGVSYGMITPFVGITYAIKGLVAMIVGGVGSLRGAVLGALLIGVVEAVAVTWFGSQMKDLSVFIVLFLVLATRPSGLFPVPGGK
jgi:branched-chain amino acid transport system permease protein